MQQVLLNVRPDGTVAAREAKDMKIVSLLPAATELVGELGCADLLCAVSHECDRPESVLGLPRVTGSIIEPGLSQSRINELVARATREGRSLYTIDAKVLDELEPDLVLTQGLCEVCAVSPTTIETTLRGVQCVLPAQTKVLSFEGESLAGIRDDFLTLAKAAGRFEDATAIWHRRERQWNSVSSDDTGKRVLLLEWVDPPYSPGHWVPEQIRAAGLVSAFGEAGAHSRPMTWESIRAAKADAVGVICCGFDLAANRRFAQELRLQLSERAGFDGEVAAFDANRFFSRPTFAVVDGAQLLHDTFVRGVEIEGASTFISGRTHPRRR